MANRGSFQKGRKKTGGRKKNPGAPDEMKALFQKLGPRAAVRLAELMDDADFETVQVAACKEILDRAYGKAVQPIEADVVHKIKYEVELVFGRTQSLQGEDAQPARVPGPARNGKALGYNGSSS